MVVIGGLGWMGYRWARTAAEVVEAAERAERKLDEEYGSTRDFLPPNEGRVSDLRMEAFLSVREATKAQRQALAESIEALAPSAGEGRTAGGIRAARAGISMAPRMLEFARARNEALLEAGMGQGEYAWIYWLSYHAWLGHPAGESLLDDIMEMRSESDGAVQMHIDGFGTEEAMWQLRREIRAMLRNLELELADRSEASEVREIVAAELAAMNEDSHRMPFEDGVPEVLAMGLDPYREQLEASYSPATNPFELLELSSGPHGVTIE
jgi:hypothetical protein